MDSSDVRGVGLSGVLCGICGDGEWSVSIMTMLLCSELDNSGEGARGVNGLGGCDRS
jgi:hypothetical protein